ncbi:excisionase [Variovorax sp. WS11]|uniref:helix-turn-helix domain-containing protein n=2 Tax=Variovorax sp. WS11 TaxID=1105204 RepID=UPI000D0D4C1A|nr:helix-turn-helix domain-containing protein [Variovorax sp. WS11]NDZ17261.1 helix-turn-helix domain-containing protein [Variovorax sp. WS11]PSL81065.1 excisionase [Variovorax sp. WS11]
MATLERSRRQQPAEMTQEELEMARTAQRCIGEALDRSRAASIMLTSEDGDLPPVQLPTKALRLIGEVLGALSERQAVTVVSGKREMTTVEAAHYLNVSRPFVIREIEAGRLPHRMVGTHRRITFEDLMAYKQRMREGQKAALQRLSDHANELGLDY